MQENEIGKEQIETIAYNIYKDIKPYIQENVNDFVFWLLDFRVTTLEGMVELDYFDRYVICNYACFKSKNRELDISKHYDIDL